MLLFFLFTMTRKKWFSKVRLQPLHSTQRKPGAFVWASIGIITIIIGECRGDQQRRKTHYYFPISMLPFLAVFLNKAGIQGRDIFFFTIVRIKESNQESQNTRTGLFHIQLLLFGKHLLAVNVLEMGV